MPTIVVRTPPPVPAADDPLAEALDDPARIALREALLCDACRAVEASGSDLLVTVAPIDGDRADERALDAVETALDRGLDRDLDDPRVEPQVGSSPAARHGNTVTHLLEDRSSVGVVFAGAIVDRSTLDQATIQLRTADVVLGPAPGGRLAYAGFVEPIDFTEALDPPAIRTVAERAADADRETTTIDLRPRVTDRETLADVTALIEARRLAGDRVPETLAAWIAEFGSIDD